MNQYIGRICVLRNESETSEVALSGNKDYPLTAEVIVDYQRVIHSWTEDGCFFCKEGKHNSAYDLVRVK